MHKHSLVFYKILYKRYVGSHFVLNFNVNEPGTHDGSHYKVIRLIYY